MITNVLLVLHLHCIAGEPPPPLLKHSNQSKQLVYRAILPFLAHHQSDHEVSKIFRNPKSHSCTNPLLSQKVHKSKGRKIAQPLSFSPPQKSALSDFLVVSAEREGVFFWLGGFSPSFFQIFHLPTTRNPPQEQIPSWLPARK